MIKRLINIAKVRLTDQKLDKKIKSKINTSKVISTDEKFNLQMRSLSKKCRKAECAAKCARFWTQNGRWFLYEWKVVLI